LGDVAVFAGLALLSLLARRNTGFFVMTAAPFVAYCLSLSSSRLPTAARKLGDRFMRLQLAILPLVLIAAGWFVAVNGFYRWNSDLHEFGTGVIDGALFPVRASAFVKEMNLPAPLFNDLTTGGFLAWDRPVEGGVYIDGRLEVYDTEFLSQYTARLVEPELWQLEADRIGIKTVIFFHWWSLHRSLIRWLVEDHRWAQVYFDDVALVFVRRAGNEELVERSRASFELLRPKIEEHLLGPVSRWQWPCWRRSAPFFRPRPRSSPTARFRGCQSTGRSRRSLEPTRQRC